MAALDDESNVRQFEEARYLRVNSQFARNKIYWRELRKMHVESFRDSKKLLSFLQRKVICFEKMHRVLQEFNSSEELLRKDAGQTGYHQVGDMTARFLLDMDTGATREVGSLLEHLSKQLLPKALEKLQKHEQSAANLWERGKMCLVSWMLLEGRVAYHYSSCLQLWGGVGGSSVVSRDRWLHTTLYYSSVHRQDKWIERCNLYFRNLFQAAKDLEVSRITQILRLAEGYLTRIQETLQKCGVLSKSTADSIRALPHQVSSTQRSISEELERRVMEDCVERGNFEALARQTWLELYGQHASLRPATAQLPTPSATHLLQQTSSLRRLFLCAREEPGIMINTWIPVLVAVTSDAVLHLLKVPEHPHESSASGQPSPVLSMSQAFDRCLAETRLCFEEDVQAQLTLSAVKHSGGGAAGAVSPHTATSSIVGSGVVKAANEERLPLGQPVEVKNAEFGRWLSDVSLDELDAGRDSKWASMAESYGMDQEKDRLLEVSASFDLRFATFSLKPSAIASENLVEIVEVTRDDVSFFAFSRTVERRLTLKCRVQQEAIELVSLLQAGRTSTSQVSASSPR